MSQYDKLASPSVTKIDEDITTLDEYIGVLLKLQSTGPSVIKKKVTTEYIRPCLRGGVSPKKKVIEVKDDEDFTISTEFPKLRDRASKLYEKVIVIYYTYEPILNLPYKVKKLSWIYLSPGIRGKYRHNPLGPVRDFHGRLVGLREGKATETPQKPKTLYHWGFDKERREVRCNRKGPIRLEPRLFSLWHYLYTHAGKTIKVGTLFNEGWEKVRDHLPTHKRIVKEAINALRQALLPLSLRKEELDLIIMDVKKGRVIIGWRFNNQLPF